MIVAVILPPVEASGINVTELPVEEILDCDQPDGAVQVISN